MRPSVPSERPASLLLLLPLEIRHQVTDGACIGDLRTSLSLRMVSTAFHHRASLHSFRTVGVTSALTSDNVIGSFTSPQTVASFFRDDAGMRKSVRSLVLRRTSQPPSDEFVRDALALIDLFPNLQSLTFHRIPLLITPTTCLPRRLLLVLKIHRSTISLPHLDDLLTLIPSVTTVTLDRCYIPLDLPQGWDDEPKFPIAAHIRHLQVLLSDAFSVEREYPPFISTPALETLKVSRLKPIDMTDELGLWILFMTKDGCSTLTLEISESFCYRP